MKLLIVLSCVVAVAFCAPAPATMDQMHLRMLPALRHEEVHDEYGQYALRYVTAENTVVSEQGRLVPSINGTYVLAIQGQYEYIGDDGKLYLTRYHGGPEGFHVDGDHLPKQVPVPAI